MDWLEDLFEKATGWLGWSPEQALKAPIPHIQIALDGKIDFLVKTSAGKSKGKPERLSKRPDKPRPVKKRERPRASPAQDVADLMAALGAKKAAPSEGKG
jgi:hypothetical protein